MGYLGWEKINGRGSGQVWDGKKSKSKAADRACPERSRRECPLYTGSGRVASPVGDLFQTFSAGVLEKSDFVAGMFELVDVGPDFRLQ